MSVQTQIDRISGAVTAALAALTEKGVTVPDGTKVDGLAALIAAIKSGGMPVKAYGTITLSEDQTDEYTIDTGVNISQTDISCVIFNHNINERVQGSLLYTYVYGRNFSSGTNVSAGYRAGAANAIYQAASAGIISVENKSVLKLFGNATANYSYGLKAGYKYLWFVMEGA